jgi:putative two-component system response regulator
MPSQAPEFPACAPQPVAFVVPAVSPPAAVADAADVERARIMIVDDEPINIKVVQRHLTQAGYRNFLSTTLPVKAAEMIVANEPDVILLDIVMPIVSGLDILANIRADARLAHIPVIILTASDDRETRVQALNLGATDLLSKPVDVIELLPRVRNALLVKSHHNHLVHYAEELQRQVAERTAELTRSRLEVIHCLGRAAEYRDNETGSHVVRVGRYAGIIARRLGLTPQHVELVELAAPLHDMGKLGIPDAILLKPGKLSPDEFTAMKEHCRLGGRTFEPLSDGEWESYRHHPSIGEKILDVAASPILEMAARIALSHHEKWNGQGYPTGLRGEDIPIEGRITAVADVFDALSSHRPYKPAFPPASCFAILEEGRGQHFDPRVLDAFFACREEIMVVRTELSDPA